MITHVKKAERGMAATGSVTFRSGSRPPEPIPARSLVWEVRHRGLRMAVGCSGAEAFRVLLTAGRVSEDTAGFILLDSPDRPAASYLARALVRSFAEATCPQHAAARFLHFMDAQCRVDHALVGLWEESSGTLSFFAPGFETPAVIQGSVSHRLDGAMERKTDNGPQKLSFGAHHLSPGERWLFHTAPVVERQSVWARGYSSIRLLRHACKSRTMPNEEWMDHLLERSLKAHKDSLPAGALLVSVVCEASEDTPADSWPPPLERKD